MSDYVDAALGCGNHLAFAREFIDTFIQCGEYGLSYDVLMSLAKSKVEEYLSRKAAEKPPLKRGLSRERKKTVEMQYSPIKPQIIIEKYLIEEGQPLPIEYKIHVFNGKARSMYVVTSRGVDIRYNNYYIDWTPFDGSQFNGWKKTDYPLKKPDHWNDMVEMAEILAKPFPFVRVDLYNINGRIYVGEFTFFHWGGIVPFEPIEWDYELGRYIKL